jgi:hypothetical protein
VDEVVRPDMVKETLHVEKEEGGRKASRHGSMGSMYNRVDRIGRTMIVPRAKLRRQEDVVRVGVLHEAPGDDPLKELPTAL